MEEKIITISFSGFLKVINREKWLILLFFIFSASLAVLYAIRLKDEYTSTGKILPEVKGANKLSGFANLAAIAGVNINQEGSEAIRPDLYPDVINSVPFYLYLLNNQVVTEGNKKIPFKQYAFETFFKSDSLENYKARQPIKSLNNGSIAISHFTNDLIKVLRERVTASMDKKNGVIMVSAKMQDRYVATQVAGIALNYLTNYISNYRTQKEKQNLVFFEEQMQRAKNRFYSTQAQKAQYADNYQQQYMRMQGMDVKRERIETEYQFSQSFYKQLEQQYEQAKIELQKETPVLEVLEPPVVPNEKSEPRRSIIVLLMTFIGLLFGMIVAMIRKQNYKSVFVSE